MEKEKPRGSLLAGDLPCHPQRLSDEGKREQERLEMYGGIGDVWRDYGRLRKIDGVNQQGGGVRREIVWLNSPLTSLPPDG